MSCCCCFSFQDYYDIMECVLTKAAECFSIKFDRLQTKTIIFNLRTEICLTVKLCFSSYYAGYQIVNSPSIEIREDVQVVLFAWAIFAFYIVCIERHYILFDDDDIEYRITWFKLTDLLQNIMFFAASIITISKYYEPGIQVILLIVQIFDLILNSYEWYHMKKKYEKKQNASDEIIKDGSWLFYLFSCLGQVYAFYILYEYMFRLKPINFPFIVICFVCVLIQWICTGIELYNLFDRHKQLPSRPRLGLITTYGFGFGLCSVYFTPISALIIAYVYLKRFFMESSNKVSPVDSD